MSKMDEWMVGQIDEWMDRSKSEWIVKRWMNARSWKINKYNNN